MAHDKQQTSNRSTRPLTTTFNTQNKTNKSPLTPRLAAQLSSPRTPVQCRSTQNALAKDAPPDALSTPVKAFLGANITPRSGPRKARVESTNTTPVSTPDRNSVESKHKTTVFELASTPKQRFYAKSESGFRSKTPSLVASRRPISRTASPERIADPQADLQTAPTTAPFFHADGVRASWESPKSPSERGDRHSKTSSFCYANGETFDTAPTSPCESFVSFRTNGAQSVAESRNTGPYSPPMSGFHNPRAGDRQTSNGQSPSRTEHSDALAHQNEVSTDSDNRTPRHRNHSPSTNGGFSTCGGPKETGPSPEGRASILGELAAMESTHRKSMSLGSLEHNAFRHRRSDSVSSGTRPKRGSLVMADFPRRADPQAGTASINHAAASPTAPGEGLVDDSPKRKIQQMAELAASARTERKVLDLEISNSSLMAINRTLERKVRKQNAELRRFRRLSRSGRLSLASTTTSLGFSIARPLSLSGIEDLPESTERSEDESGLSPSPSDDDEDDSVDDCALSPSALAQSDARHRHMDERRLQLDLARHQRLLVDSHKMNESLKRCLGWTEELISEGKKALDYKVRVSDIAFGGRILVADDVDDPRLGAADFPTYLHPPRHLMGDISPAPSTASFEDDAEDRELFAADQFDLSMTDDGEAENQVLGAPAHQASLNFVGPQSL